MDYKKEYEEKLSKAITLHKLAVETNNDNTRMALEELYPELKESEDDRMRKMAIKAVNSPEAQSCIKSWGVEPKDVIAWLEKQGSKEENLKEHNICDTCEESNGCVIPCCAKLLEKQGEQKPTDKVEPKFKVGDWIISSEGTLRHIVAVDKTGYETDKGWLTHDDYEKGFHLWTIQDAKDGDVLVAKIDKEPNDFIYIFKGYDEGGFWSHCYLDAYINKFHEGIYHNNYNVGVPSTKEQRELLFTKMKEAGYEWDAENKELREIEQKPAWSKEDEEMFDAIIADIQFTQKAHTHEVNQVVYEREIDWLKSLKERVQPQPKKEWSKEMGSLCLDALGLLKAYGDVEGVDPKSQLGIKINRASAFLTDLYHEAFYPNTYNPRPDLKLTAWSEEDERNLSIAIQYVFQHGYLSTVNWLKSLKERYSWKPSDEQIKLLREVQQALLGNDCHNRFVNFMYELKRLREE